MSLDDRAGWFLVGCTIGAIIGYTVKAAEAFWYEFDLDKKHVRLRNSESGVMGHRFFGNLALAFVVFLTMWASFVSQRASNSVVDTQDQVKLVVSCNQHILEEALSALNERTEFTDEQVAANIDLQKAQSRMFDVLVHEPPYTELETNRATRTYFDSLLQYLRLSEKSQTKQIDYAYPTISELQTCIDGTDEK